MSDFTKHNNEDRKKLYLDRHRKRENWNDFMSAGSLSRWILWNKTTLESSINETSSEQEDQSEKLFDQENVNEEEEFEIPAFLRKQKF